MILRNKRGIPTQSLIVHWETHHSLIMSQCLVPNWNPKQQRQEQVEAEDGSKSSSHHVHNPMSNYEVAELTWENGQLAIHGLGGPLPPAQTKPTWSRAHDTLESIVQQATCQYQKSNFTMAQEDHAPTSISSTVAPSGRTTVAAENSGQTQTVPMLTRKRTWSDSGNCGRNFSSNTNILEECDPSSGGCASASATFCRDNDTTMMTWASLESGRSLKSSKTLEEDSPSHCESENRDQEEDGDAKVEIGRSNTRRRNRAAAIHNQSERRRRDRINQRMKALQRLVPNASKTDKASMLDEVIEYLKQLQAQIQMMSMRNMPQQMMMLPLAMQQQLQMSMLARMGVGLGLGMGMLNMNTMAAAPTAPPPSLPQLTVGAPAIAPSFMMPSLIQAHAPPKPEPASAATTNASVSLPDPYATFLSQSLNMDYLNSMAELYRQQIRQNSQGLSSQSQQHHGQGD